MFVLVLNVLVKKRKILYFIIFNEVKDFLPVPNRILFRNLHALCLALSILCGNDVHARSKICAVVLLTIYGLNQFTVDAVDSGRGSLREVFVNGADTCSVVESAVVENTCALQHSTIYHHV